MNSEGQKEQLRKQGGAGRKPKLESRSAELRQTLIAWKQTPESSRPSLRALARALGTTHQLLGHYLVGLDEWRWQNELEQLRANAKARGVTVTPALERRFLAWLKKLEARQAREAAKAAKWENENAALINRLKEGVNHLPDSWGGFAQRTQGRH